MTRDAGGRDRERSNDPAPWSRPRGAWVLVTDGGHGASRDCVAAVRAIARAGYRAAITVSGARRIIHPSRHARRRIPVPSAAQDGFAAAVREELARGDYLTLLPASESAMIALGMGLPHLVDKSALYDAARVAGIETPPWRLCEGRVELERTAAALGYPLIAKPRVRNAGAMFIDGPRDLARLPASGMVVQKYATEGLRAVSGVVRSGRLAAVVHERWHRIWPRRCGLASASETTAPDRRIEERLLRLMEGYEGIFCAQLAGDSLFDLNLRIHSSHPLAVAAGVNLVGLHCDLEAGRPVPEVPLRPRTGVLYRWLEGDLRHLISAVRNREIGPFTAVRRFRPFAGEAHSIESLDDPGPMISRVLVAGSRLRHGRSEPARGG